MAGTQELYQKHFSEIFTDSQGNSQFHKELSTAVDYLKGAIEELGDTLENLAVRK